MRYRRSQTKGATFFFTVVTCRRRKILCHDTNITLIKEAFKYVKGRHPFTIDAIVVIPDHIHCIWTLPEKDSDFSTRWRMIKGHFTRRCDDIYKTSRTASRARKAEQGVWQRRFWEHQIRDDGDFRRHVDYIHYNPVKHGMTESPGAWPFSSFHRYVREGVYERDWGAGTKIVFDASVGHE